VYERKEKCAATATYNAFERSLFTYKEMFEDYEIMLKDAEWQLLIMTEQDCDMMPYVNTYCSIGMVAEAFGAKIEILENGFPFVTHIVDNVKQAAEIIPKKIEELDYYQRLCGWTDYYKKHGKTDFPFWSLDIQSPFSVAAQIVPTEVLLMACYDEPEEVHRLLNHVTECTILLQDHHYKQAENNSFPGRCFPSVRKNIGVCIADDTPVIMLSEEMYREFALPYNNILGRHYGGIHLHSCGGYARNVNAILDIENIRSMHLHAGDGEFGLPYTPILDGSLRKAADSITMFVDTNIVSRGDYINDVPRFYEQYLLPRLKLLDPNWLILECPVTELDVYEHADAVISTRKMLRDIGYNPTYI
jgi:hypothetical protein